MVIQSLAAALAVFKPMLDLLYLLFTVQIADTCNEILLIRPTLIVYLLLVILCNKKESIHFRPALQIPYIDATA